MKRLILTSTSLAFVLSSLYGFDDFNGWKVSGDIRTGWVTYDYNNPPSGIDNDGNIIPSDPNINKGHTDSKGWYIIPKLSLTTPTYKNFYVKASVAGATDFGINDEKYESRNFVFDPDERKSFAILQEGYVAYKSKEHKLLVGREEIETPMIDADDYYMQANSFEVTYYQNHSFENSTIMFGYFSKMAGVWDSGANGTKFESMSKASFIDKDDKEHIGDKGVAFASYDFNNKHHHLQIWNYYGFDMYNTFYLQYDYLGTTKTLNFDIGIKWINFKEVGYLATDKANTDIDYSICEARFDGNFKNGFNFATGIAKFSNGPGQSATLGAWGGYYYFANGMVFHFFDAGSLQNATNYKAQIGYDFKYLINKNISMYYRYTYFDLDPTHSKTKNDMAQDKKILNGLRIVYGKSLGWYFNGTYEYAKLDNEPNIFALRLIGGYRF